MKTKLVALAVLAGGSMFAQSRFSVGVQVGGYGQGYYAPAPVYADQRPPSPGPDYDWVDGYWGESYGRRAWSPGYWNRRAYVSRYNEWREREHREHEYREHQYREREREHERHERDFDRYGAYGYRGR